MKAILLAGGMGTRLYPLTKAISKQLLPIFDKPMIYYSLSIIMLADIREVLLICRERDLGLYKEVLSDGARFGISIEYKVQDSPNGLPEAFIIGEDFIENDAVCLVLADNFIYGQGLTKGLQKWKEVRLGALIFAYYEKDVSQYGVVEFNDEFEAISIEEKPKNPKSNFAIPGIYFYDNSVVDKAKQLRPSSRNELEISDLNRIYMKEKSLRVEVLGRGIAWLDTGTHRTLAETGRFVEIIQKRQGLYVGCIEEIAYNRGWIDEGTLDLSILEYGESSYGAYLKSLKRK